MCCRWSRKQTTQSVIADPESPPLSSNLSESLGHLFDYIPVPSLVGLSGNEVRKGIAHADDVLSIVEGRRYLYRYADAFNRLPIDQIRRLDQTIADFACVGQPEQFIDGDDALKSLFVSAHSAFPLFAELVEAVAAGSDGEGSMGPIKDLRRIVEKLQLEYADPLEIRANLARKAAESIASGIDQLGTLVIDRCSASDRFQDIAKQFKATVADVVADLEGSRDERWKLSESSLTRARKILDVLRASIVFEDLESLVNALGSIRAMENVTVVLIKSGFNADLKRGGYKDVKVNVRIGGHIAELQLHLREYWNLKRASHEIYERLRQMPLDGSLDFEDQILDTSPQSSRVMEAALALRLRSLLRESGAEKQKEKLVSALLAYCLQGSVSSEFVNLAHDLLKNTRYLNERTQLRIKYAQLLIEALRFEESKWVLEELEKSMLISSRGNQSGVPFPLLYRVYALKSHLLVEIGEFNSAIAVIEEAIICSSQCFGMNHPNTVKLQIDKGQLFARNSDNESALAIHEHSLQELQEKSREAIENTLVARLCINIGSVYNAMAQFNYAIEYFERALAIRIKRLGEDHPGTAYAYNGVGTAYSSLGEYDLAIEYYEKALNIYTIRLGKDHPLTGKTCKNIGDSYEGKGDYDLAIKYYEKDLAIIISVLGEDHPDCAVSYNHIGCTLSKKGEYDRAIKYYEKALVLKIKRLGAHHSENATLYNRIGSAYDHLGEYDLAIENYQRDLAIRIKTFGENNPSLTSLYLDIGNAYNSKGGFDLAIENYKTVLAIKMGRFGEDHPTTASLLNKIGTACESKGDYDSAIEYFEKALAIFIKKCHPAAATSYTNIGGAYYFKRDFDLAIEYFEKALAIGIKRLGEDHPDIATSYNSLGNSYKSKGDYAHAIECFRNALAISMKNLGDDHPETLRTKCSLADVMLTEHKST